MRADFLYKTPGGRAFMKIVQTLGLMKIAAAYLRSGLSKGLIQRYIDDNGIDMTPFEGQTYGSFEEFFARHKDIEDFESAPEVLMSPCDGMVSVYNVTEDLNLPMKGSNYRLCDIVPDSEVASAFQGGICFVLRLQASDYHHFCAFDDIELGPSHYIPGQLHSVQPIACDHYPVYRLNRRWWRELKSAHFGPALQIEVGAMMVSGISYTQDSGTLCRGEDMGNFELSGSTIVLILNRDVRERLRLREKFQPALGGQQEVPMKLGEALGTIANEN